MDHNIFNIEKLTWDLHFRAKFQEILSYFPTTKKHKLSILKWVCETRVEWGSNTRPSVNQTRTLPSATPNIFKLLIRVYNRLRSIFLLLTHLILRLLPIWILIWNQRHNIESKKYLTIFIITFTANTICSKIVFLKTERDSELLYYYNIKKTTGL